MNPALLVWLILSIIWGTTWLFIKLGLEGLPPFTFAGLRFVLAIIPLFILLKIKKTVIPRSRQDWWYIFVTGMLTISCNYGLVFWGENHISSGLTAIFYSTFPLFGLVIAHLILPSEPMTWVKSAGIVLGIAGVTLIFSNQLQIANTEAVWGSLAIILASLGTAYANVLVKHKCKEIEPLALTFGQMGLGFIPLLLLGLLLEGNPLALDWNLRALISLGYLAFVGSALAFVLVYWLIQQIDVTKTQLIPLASTLIAVILGKILLHEALSWRTIVGGLGILGGLTITILGYKKNPSETV